MSETLTELTSWCTASATADLLFVPNKSVGATFSVEIKKGASYRSQGVRLPSPDQVRAAFTSEIPVSSRIESNPGVCGGSPCIVRTRIPIWSLEAWRRQGLSDQEILNVYPTLRAEDLTQAWRFVGKNKSEIEKQIHLNENA